MIQLVDWESELWDELRGAYGNASDDIKNLLEVKELEEKEDSYLNLMHFIKSYYFGVEGGSYRMDWGE